MCVLSLLSTYGIEISSPIATYQNTSCNCRKSRKACSGNAFSPFKEQSTVLGVNGRKNDNICETMKDDMMGIALKLAFLLNLALIFFLWLRGSLSSRQLRGRMKVTYPAEDLEFKNRSIYTAINYLTLWQCLSMKIRGAYVSGKRIVNKYDYLFLTL